MKHSKHVKVPSSPLPCKKGKCSLSSEVPGKQFNATTVLFEYLIAKVEYAFFR